MPPIIVTENGASFEDIVETDNSIQDRRRVEFFKNYLSNVLKAKKEGVDLRGYFVWTFMDNFEWAEGYKPRFGLVHVDFSTQERRIKDSGNWFKEFLR
jgi:beta-glucosidase